MRIQTIHYGKKRKRSSKSICYASYKRRRGSQAFIESIGCGRHSVVRHPLIPQTRTKSLEERAACIPLSNTTGRWHFTDAGGMGSNAPMGKIRRGLCVSAKPSNPEAGKKRFPVSWIRETWFATPSLYVGIRKFSLHLRERVLTFARLEVRSGREKDFALCGYSPGGNVPVYRRPGVRNAGRSPRLGHFGPVFLGVTSWASEPPSLSLSWLSF
jgi:hypothetical protein